LNALTAKSVSGDVVNGVVNVDLGSGIDVGREEVVSRLDVRRREREDVMVEEEKKRRREGETVESDQEAKLYESRIDEI
jgi:hypothetical protein